ncbi:MAG: heme ABC transporter permease [Rickettsiaceae bacterium]|nr:MAG: heme ABC transporter permease [Rickettsiaceae bacterium]
MIKLLNPHNFNKVTNKLIPVLTVAMLTLTTYGLYQALLASPIDYQQGEMVRIMYVHVPSAWMSMGIYIFMAFCSLSNLVWKTKLTYILAVAAAPIGACFAVIALVTGSLWGKPIWGTWWVWDARLTSMFILFLFYIMYIAVVNSGDNLRRSEKPASVIALIGSINIPIVKFSVNLWYSLHQGASIMKSNGPSIHSSMLLPLMIMFGSFICYFLLVLILRTQRLLKIFNTRNNL